jgi:hypothetical protein
MSGTTVQTGVQWHDAIFNATRTLPDFTSIYLYQRFIKTAINTATVKLLTSKVTLLNKAENDST